MIITGKPERGRVLFAHGAGAGMDSLFMQDMAERMAGLGLEVQRFNFPYMMQRVATGTKRPPDRMPRLLEYFVNLIEQLPDDGVPLWLAGKSMGGRVATMLAAEGVVQEAWAFGYPFHPRGKPETLRVDHLQSPQGQIHLFQGTRDPMGNEAEVSGYSLGADVHLHWLADGDHDLKPRQRSGYTQSGHLDAVIEVLKERVSG